MNKKRVSKVLIFAVIFVMIFSIILPDDNSGNLPLGLKKNQKYTFRMDGYRIIGKVLNAIDQSWIQIEVVFDSSFSLKAKTILINLLEVSIIERDPEKGE